MRTLTRLVLFLAVTAAADQPLPPAARTAPAGAELLLREIRYAGSLTDTEARFVATIDAESRTKREAAIALFEGDVAVLPAKLPPGLRLARAGNTYRLVASRPGQFRFQLEVVARITRAEPWNAVSFLGPAAGIAAISAQASNPQAEVQLLSGTPAEAEPADRGRVRGVLGTERRVALRWQSQSAETTRRALVTAETAATVTITPTVIKFSTGLHYEIVQGQIEQLSVTLPTNQALTRVEGAQIRDWRSRIEGDRQVLSIQLLRAVEKRYDLKLSSEQALEQIPALARLTLPQPQGLDRESGSLTVLAEDTAVETEPAASLRQVDAPARALAAYRFYARPITLAVQVRRLEPVVTAASRLTARLEETRLVVSDTLNLTIERAGLYAIELSPLSGFTVTDVRGDGLEDWTTRAGRLLVNFSSRALGERTLTVQLERPETTFPNRVVLTPLKVAGATRQTTRIGAASAPGIRLKTGELTGLREVPAASLAGRTDELLAYAADQADWSLRLDAERLAPRIVADVFNLVTIGDGLVGGSATIRYGIANQGVQEFQIRLPARWRNVEFTGPDLRRRELLASTGVGADTNTVVWRLGLQDKAWGGYTLVVSYDEPFEPQQATLSLGGLHSLDAERETGSIAVTCAASLQLREARVSGPLRRIDAADLAATDRALLARSVLLAYRYDTQDAYQLQVGVTRFQELPVLQAVSDRTQLTTVLTDAGQMLTEASFMVKNNDKQFQRFTLPAGAEFWSASVDGQPVKAEQQDGTLLVPLPRGVDRDRAFAVDLVYAQRIGPLTAWLPRDLRLAAPRTDVQTTFAEWELYVPLTHQLTRFGGNLSVAPGTTYGWRDAWAEFLGIYREVFATDGMRLGMAGALLAIALAGAAIRRGWQGVVVLGAAVVVLAVLAGMLLPTLGKAKAKSIQISAVNNRHDSGMPSAQPAPPQAAEEVVRMRFESAGLGGGVAAGPVSRAAGTTQVGTPRAQGIRPIRIEIPRAGQRFVFTKVLNVGDEVLRVEARAVAAGAWRALRGALQIAVFLGGLLLLWRQLRRPIPGSFMVALALALVLGSVASLLIVMRWLGMALVVAAPLLVLVFVAYLAWRLVHPHGGGPAAATPAGTPRTSIPPPVPGAGPAVAALALLLFVNSIVAEPPPQSAVTGCDVEFISIPSAAYTGTVRQRVAEFDAVVQLTASRAGQTVPLFGADVAIESFTAAPRDVVLVRQGDFVCARLPRKGDATVTARFLAKLGGDVTRRRLEFGIPPALSSRLTLILDEPEAAVEFPSAVAYQLVNLRQQTRVQAVIGAGDRVELQWAPRGQRAIEIAATVFCHNASLVTFGGGVVRTRAQLDYQVTQGEAREVRVRLPAGERLLRVSGEGIRTWRVTDDPAAPVLTVELLKAMPANYRLTLETEHTLDKLPLAWALATPHPLDLQRETGLIGLNTSDELGLTIDATRGLQKIDAAEFQAATGETNALATAYRFLKPDFALSARVAALQPQLEATVGNRVRIGVEQLELTAQIHYVIKRAGVFGVRLTLPEGFQVEAVTGRDIVQWADKSEPAGRVLEVTFKQRTLGAYALQVQLVKSEPALPKSVAIAGVQPLDAAKLTGFVVVSAEAGVQIRPLSSDGLTEVPVTTVPDGGTGLAYQFIANAPLTSRPAWRLAVATDAVEPWIRAEVVNWLTLGDTLVRGRALVRYEIQNAPLKEFGLRIPAAFRNVEITGANIRRRDQNGEQWRVELQNRVVGVCLLTVTWEQPWTLPERQVTSMAVVGVEATGVERETGALAVQAKPELQVLPKGASAELIRIDPQELPGWAGNPGPTTVLAYHYLRPGYKLSLDAQRFAPAEVLQALADNVRLTTVVADDGQMMSELALSVRNRGRQFLEIALPRGAQAWSAFVAGQAVRPSVHAGKLLLPLERSGDAPIPVSLIYVSAEEFPRASGTVALESPALDVPMQNARWELYLPAGYRYSRFAGTVSLDPAAAPVYTRFTRTEYSIAEDRNQGVRDRAMVRSLEAVRRTLSAGKLEEASKAYNQARQLERFAAGEETKLREVEKDLRTAQVGNLLTAQQSVVMNNAAYFGQRFDQPAQTQAGRYDEQVAERQWDKLQQAQEVAAATLRPLRLNLPTRGLRQSFSQVLQTEAGVPMRIRFVASNQETASWPARIGWVAAGFAGLWGMVGLGLRHRKVGAALPAGDEI
ncbi:MAG: hypothetical protein KGS61_00280 [Verrucomicrobia bacterium]|nr:hypothetical protein [Verrucomicrobiota bacterium]